MLDSKGSLRDDLKDACYLFDFVTEKQRSVAEVEEEINKLAHQKYCLDSWGRGTKAGHDLRHKYKRFLRQELKECLDYILGLKSRGERMEFKCPACGCVQVINLPNSEEGFVQKKCASCANVWWLE